MKAGRQRAAPLFIILTVSRTAARDTDEARQSLLIKTYGTLRKRHCRPSFRHHTAHCIFIQNHSRICILIHRKPRENRLFTSEGITGRKYASFTHIDIINYISAYYTNKTSEKATPQYEKGFSAPQESPFGDTEKPVPACQTGFSTQRLRHFST